MFWHSQNLNEKKYDKMGSILRHGRAWLHFGKDGRRSIGWEWSFPSHFCLIEFEIGDEGWKFAVAPFGLFGIWIHFDGFALLKRLSPKRKCIATWDGGREFWLIDERECSLSFSDWTLRIHPWSKSMEWCKADPWWVRGISLNLPDLLLGRNRHTCTTVNTFDIEIPMPEKNYPAKVNIEHGIWKRPLWLAKVRRSAWVEIPGGIPFPGKGENSWDCGMDGLFGYGCSGIKAEEIIAQGVQSVLESRRKYAGSVAWVPAEADQWGSAGMGGEGKK